MANISYTPYILYVLYLLYIFHTLYILHKLKYIFIYIKYFENYT